MAIYPQVPKKRDWDPPPEVTSCPAVYVDAILHEDVETEWKGKKSTKTFIEYRWQLDPNDPQAGFHEWKDDEGVEYKKPWLVIKWYTLGLGDKSNLLPVVEGTVMRSLTKDEKFSVNESERFNLEQFADHNDGCLITIRHKPKETGEGVKIVVSVAGLPSGMEPPKPADYVRVKDREDEPTF